MKIAHIKLTLIANCINLLEIVYKLSLLIMELMEKLK